MIRNVKIPEDRISVVIGTGGETKRKIQKMTKTRLTIEEEITIEGDSVDILVAENVVKAIGRGFSPDIALLLCKEENVLDVIPLPKDRKELNRIKSRLIGTKGKTRRNIEGLTRTFITVYGKTVSIIGAYDNVAFAHESIENLISGAAHKTVYKLLEEKQKVIKEL